MDTSKTEVNTQQQPETTTLDTGVKDIVPPEQETTTQPEQETTTQPEDTTQEPTTQEGVEDSKSEMMNLLDEIDEYINKIYDIRKSISSSLEILDKHKESIQQIRNDISKDSLFIHVVIVNKMIKILHSIFEIQPNDKKNIENMFEKLNKINNAIKTKISSLNEEKPNFDSIYQNNELLIDRLRNKPNDCVQIIKEFYILIYNNMDILIEGTLKILKSPTEVELNRSYFNDFTNKRFEYYEIEKQFDNELISPVINHNEFIKKINELINIVTRIKNGYTGKDLTLNNTKDQLKETITHVRHLLDLLSKKDISSCLYEIENKKLKELYSLNIRDINYTARINNIIIRTGGKNKTHNKKTHNKTHKKTHNKKTHKKTHNKKHKIKKHKIKKHTTKNTK